MKKIFFIVFFLLLSIASFSSVFAEITESDRQLWSKVVLIVNSINDDSDVESIYGIISPNASESLKEEIKNNIEGKKLQYGIELEDVEEISSEKVKLNCRFVAVKNIGYIIHFTSRIDGLKTYFVFEKIDGEWYLLESDLAKKLDAKVFNLIFIIIPLVFGFWIWMLVDVAKKPIEKKTLWVLMIVFLNVIGAMIYFFTARRRYVKNIKKEENYSKENK